MYHVHTKIKRADKALIASLKAFGVATVYEASGKTGFVDSGIKPLKRGIKISGTAVTVQCKAKDNLMLHKALQIAQEGDVLVTSTEDYPNAGYFGGLMATSGLARKLGGLVIDGCVRDSEEIVEMGFPVFCRGTCIRGTHKNELGLINHPLDFCGTIVHPGDIILGDDDGIVVVPFDRIEEIIEASRKRVEKEEEKSASLARGIPGVELNKLDAVFESLGLKEEK